MRCTNCCRRADMSRKVLEGMQPLEQAGATQAAACLDQPHVPALAGPSMTFDSGVARPARLGWIRWTTWPDEVANGDGLERTSWMLAVLPNRRTITKGERWLKTKATSYGLATFVSTM